MIDHSPSPSPRRIFAAFHPSTTSRLAIETVVDLAFRLRAELNAMFIEDADLLNLADYPFHREIGLHGRVATAPERQAIENELRAFARQAERHLAETATRQRVRWSFITSHGRIEDQIKTIGSTVDLLIVESSSRPIGRVMQLETSARTVAKLAGGSVLMVHPTQRLAEPVHAIIQSTDEAKRVTKAAAELADRFEGALGIHLVVDETARNNLDAIVKDHLGRVAEQTITEAVAAIDRQELERILELSRGGMLVLSADNPLLTDDDTWNAIARSPCAVLLVR
ncbi:MAG: hypothetical protein OEU92_30660 [Alphaproteobacteria bacterium]|nr:hypothetical protein [Alphaproteobacteria bacterium]